jgi:hypothetical protein
MMTSSPDCTFSMRRDRFVLAVWIFTCTIAI